MLDIGFNRRDFLRVGGIGAGMSALGLSDYGNQQTVEYMIQKLTSLLALIGKSFPSIRAN